MITRSSRHPQPASAGSTGPASSIAPPALPIASRGHGSRRRLLPQGRYVLLAVAAAVVLLPFAWTVYASFVRSDLDVYGFPASPSAYGIDNYAFVLGNSQVLRWYFNSALIAVSVLAGNVAFNTAAGYALARLPFRGSRLLFVAVLATMMIPPQVLFVPVYTMIVKFGWLNSYYALIVPFLVNPFGVFLMRQFYCGFSEELEEAALLDGLSYWGIFVRLALPLSKPALAAQAIFIFVWNWNTFVFPSVLATSPNMFTLPVGIYQITHTSFTNNVAQGMAGVLLTTIPSVIVFSVLQRHFVASLTGMAKG